MRFKTDYHISRPIIGGVVLFILFALIGIKYERSLVIASQWSRVNIEILPGETSKFIDASTRARVPVAILSSMNFDASTVNPVSVRLAGAPITKNKKGQLRGFLVDVNGDGRIDLVVYVSAFSLNLDPGTSDALLTANTFDGQSVSGSQQVSFRGLVVPDSALYAAASLNASVSNPAKIVIRDTVDGSPMTAKPYPSDIIVSGQPTVTKLTVSLSNYSHTFPDDVDILLVGPTGAKCLLMADCGGSDFLNNLNLTFDDTSPPLPDESQISSGTYGPTKGTCSGGGSNCVPANFPGAAPAGPYGTALSVFNGTDPNGTWHLYVVDDSSGDDGSIFGGWSLTINPAYDTDGDGMPDFVEATEGTNPNVKDNNVFINARWFAMQQYRDFLGREGDPGGITNWTNAITSGSLTRAQVIGNGFFGSQEFQGTVSPIVRLYFAYFLRIPDYGGLQNWLGAYRSGVSLANISEGFAQAPEFVQKYGNLNNSDFVTLLYNNVLGRSPDPDGFAGWLNALNNGATRGSVMLGFSESPEFKTTSFNKVYVTMTYVGMLGRSPDQGGFDNWVAFLNSGASGLQIIQGFLDSPEYHNRFLP